MKDNAPSGAMVGSGAESKRSRAPPLVVGELKLRVQQHPVRAGVWSSLAQQGGRAPTGSCKRLCNTHRSSFVSILTGKYVSIADTHVYSSVSISPNYLPSDATRMHIFLDRMCHTLSSTSVTFTRADFGKRGAASNT